MLIGIPERVIKLLFCMLIAPLFMYGSTLDTIPPVIFDPPEDFNIDCESEYLDELKAWHENFAGTRADDNSGIHTLHSIYSFEEVDSLLIMSRDTLCSGSASLAVGYFALDTCFNSSDTLYASFNIVDDEKPTIFTAAIDVSFDCDYGIIDSLNNWIDNYGFAVAMDNCSDTVIWNNYFWSDSEGNSGFVNIGDPTTISIQRTTCDWTVNVSFFVLDECGNANVSNASFSLTGDTIAPDLIMALPDTLIECDMLPFLTQPIFEDGCDGILDLVLDEQSTQDPDSTKCEHYNYSLTRIWTAMDVCGNSSSTSHNIFIQDSQAPEVNYNNFVFVNCDFDIVANAESLIDATDNCSDLDISYNDIIVEDESCQTLLDRNFTVLDACGNSFHFVQTIQIQDIEAPVIVAEAEDQIYYCGVADTIQQRFLEWRDSLAFSQALDGCNGSRAYALNKDSYSVSDIGSITNAAIIELDLTDCLSNNSKEIIRQEVDFVYLDSCDNVSISSAQFVVVDTISPVIETCSPDLFFSLKTISCDTILEIPVPIAIDACELFGKAYLEYSVIINQGLRVDFFNSITENISFEVGTHNLEYIVFDCAGNSANCFQTIEIREETAPELTCPSDKIYETDIRSCSRKIVFPQDYSIDENCQSSFTYEETQPTGPGYISFYNNSELDTFVANNVFLGYMNVEFFGSVSKPSLEIFFNGDTDNSNEYFTLLSESGQELQTIQFSEANCSNTASTIIEFEINDFLTWASNGTIFFTLVPNEISTDGVNPCIPLTENGTDEISFMRATLRYSDIFPSFELKNQAGNIIPVPSFKDSFDLDVGSYTAKYLTADASGNQDSCSFSITVEDREAPVIDCMVSDTLFITPSLFGLSQFGLNDFNINSSDNCEITDYFFEPSVIECSDIGNRINVEITAEDGAGNINSCVANIPIETIRLRPDFSSGLCIDDTLKLIANHQLNDPFNVLQYNWSGPNDFVSNDENPTLEITDQSISGLYNLEIIDAVGCSFYGSIEIEVQALNSPEIFADQSIICEGENVLLNSTSFTESVNYLWYEGVSPNGVLLIITAGPSVQIEPTPGEHFYYVEIEGENCNTNESNTIQVMVQSTPNSQVENPFITICEGENIVLSAEDTDTDLDYFWMGPAGYQSTGQFPDVILNAEAINGGSYGLVVSKNGCMSDTAFTQVVVFPRPLRPVISGESVFCEGSNFVLSVNNVQTAEQYLWYKDGILTNSLNSNNLIIPGAQSSLSGMWTVVVQDGLCFSDTSSVFEAIVNPEINIGATNNGPVCQGDSVTISSSFLPDASYLWSSPSGNILNGRILTISAEPGTYTLTVTTTSNCSNVASTEVELIEVPQITALSNSSQTCMSSNNSIVFVPSVFPPGNYDYFWTGPDNFESGLESPKITNAAELNNGVYTLQIKDGECFSAPVSTTVDIEIIPETPDVFLISSACEGDSLVFQAFGTGIIEEYIWNTPKGSVSTTENVLLLEDVDVTDNGFYSVQLLKEQCTSDLSDSLEINLFDRVEKPVITGLTEICEGETLQLDADFVANSSYIWEGPQGTINQTGSTLELANVTLQDEGEYYVVRSVNGCVSDSSLAYNVIVKETPEPPGFVENQLEICYDPTEDLTICLNDILQANEQFFLFDFEQDTIIASSVGSCFNINMLEQFNQNEIILSAKRRLDGCLSDHSDIFTLTRYLVPEEQAQFEFDTMFVCQSSSISLNVLNDQNFDLSVSSDDPSLDISIENNNQIVVQNISQDATTLNLSSSFNICDDFGTDNIVLLLGKELEAANDSLILDYNTEVDISIIENDNYSNDINIEIIDDDGLELQLDQEGMLTIKTGNQIVGNRTIIYEICVDGCIDLCDRAEVFISIGNGNDCFVGNLLTPNGDGINDILIIPCLTSGDFPDNSLVVFSQWGNELYKSSPYNNDWDLNYNGEILPNGTYFYQLDFGGDEEAISGFLVVER